MNYIEVLGRCFPDAQAYVTGQNSPEVYGNLIWISTPISQNDIDTNQCVLDTYDQTTGEEITSEYDVDGQGHGGGIFTLSFCRESTSRNVWLSHEGDNSLTSDQVPGIIPWNCKLVAMTFSNKATAADTDVRLYAAAAGDGSSSTLVDTWSIRDARIARKTQFSPDVIFGAGDKIGIYLCDKGTNVTYTTIIVYLQILDSLTADFKESFSGGL